MRVVNGAWANKGKIGIGLVVAGAGFVIWSGSMNLLSDVASTLERWGFLPTGTGDKIIAFWSRLRGVITVALFVGGFILVFYDFIRFKRKALKSRPNIGLAIW